MNRIDRLFAILLSLQNNKRVRSQDLADKFHVSKRTIYRDIVALNESNVPVVSLPGEGYELMPGYYLPPVNFTETEAVVLILGTQLLKQQAAGTVTVGAEQALEKIAAVLPGNVRERVEALTSIIGFFTDKDRFNLDDPRLIIFQNAIQNKRVVHLRYHGFDRDVTTERVLEPHQLYYAMGAWYVEGFCRLRREMRTFRLSRIEKLTLGTDGFVKRSHERRVRGETTTVKIRFDQKIVRWVRERQHYGFVKERASGNKQGGAIMTYQVLKLADIMPWTLSWGAGAEAFEPKEFREMVRNEVRKMTEMMN
jgi:predicted DNA-binding transcriptional regulator YafY